MVMLRIHGYDNLKCITLFINSLLQVSYKHSIHDQKMAELN